VEGRALCLKKEVWQKIGKWCEDYSYGYWDDVDLCYRAKLAGYPLKYVPGFIADNWTSSKNKVNPPAWFLMRHIGQKTSKDGRMDLLPVYYKNQQIFTHKFYPYLAEINLIIFPDWNQPEDNLLDDLQSICLALFTREGQKRFSLLIASEDVDREEANLLISSVIMDLVLREDSSLADQLPVTLLPLIKNLEWNPILYRLHGRIILPQENLVSIVNSNCFRLPVYTLKELTELE
jgi:hypothetical protein